MEAGKYQKCTFSWRPSEPFSGSQGTFGTILIAKGTCQKAETRSLKMISVRSFRMSKCFNKKLAMT